MAAGEERGARADAHTRTNARPTLSVLSSVQHAAFKGTCGRQFYVNGHNRGTLQIFRFFFFSFSSNV